MVRMEDGVKVEVLDHGIGIPEDDIRYIFNSFYRAGNVREYHGQGIGLSLSMRILKVYGGRISIDSCQGQYTKVTVIFKSSPKTKQTLYRDMFVTIFLNVSFKNAKRDCFLQFFSDNVSF